MDKIFNKYQIELTSFPATIKENDNTSVYLRTFCLKCCKVDASVETKSYGHDDCEGPVLLVHERFDHSSALNLDLALRKVNEQVAKLQEDEAELRDIRAKYNVTV